MKTISLKICLLLLLSLTFCSKDSSKEQVQNQEIDNYEFEELGSDAPYIYGQSYNGRNAYTTYYPGNIPIILSIPHGGDISPSEISNRTYGVTVTDSNTIELGMAISNYLFSNYSIRPYIVVNNLKRTKLDANRDKTEAAQGNIFAERAFDEFHYYISSARDEIIKNFNTGLLFDIHGHGANPDGFVDLRTWIGYLLSGSELDSSDGYLDQNINIDETSIYSMINSSDESLSNLIRGPNSLGSIFERNNYTALPSSESPGPEGMRYFSGGFNTFLYGTNKNFNFSAIQLEFPYPGLRDTSSSRNLFAIAFSEIIHEYFLYHYNIDLFSLWLSLQKKPMDFKEIFTASMILFAIIDIIGATPIVISLREKVGKIESEKATIVSMIIMIGFLFLGEEILNLIGIDINSFAVAGSIVIFFIALEMVLGVTIFQGDEPETASIVPIAFPIIAGAGTLTTLLSLRAEYELINVIIAIIINSVFVYIILKSSTRIERLLGKNGIAIIRRVFGIILLSISVKLFSTNISLIV